eukprot:1672576-Prymnesium_polylepis.1
MRQGGSACGLMGDRTGTDICTLSSAGTLRARTTRAAAAPNNLMYFLRSSSPPLGRTTSHTCLKNKQ